MDAIKKIRELGLDKVAQKTFINENDLDALLDQNFERFNRTKALGFIQILEREYGLGLGDLREACLKFYAAHPDPAEEKPLSIEQPQERPPKNRRTLLLILAALALVALVLYLIYRQSATHPAPSTEPVQNATILKEAAKNLITHKEHNQTQTPPMIATSAAPAASAPAEANGSDETNQSAADNSTRLPDNDLDLDKAVATLFKEEKRQATEANTTEANTTEINATESNASAPLAARPEHIATDTNGGAKPAQKPAQTSAKAAPPAPPKAPKTTKNAQTHTSKKFQIPKRGLYVVPVRRAWVGIIYLDTYKKRGYLIKKPLRLNTRRDMLILSGNRYIKIYANGREVPVHAKGKVRFLYERGILREIDRQTYNSYSRGIRW